LPIPLRQSVIIFLFFELLNPSAIENNFYNL
jgi:hypothetical protein